jgi:hypothetical protein
MPRTSKLSTIPLSKKGPAAQRPRFAGAAEQLALEIETWPGVLSRAHWEIGDDTTVNGADFYVGEQELGHLHLDGDAHVPMPVRQAKALIAEGKACAFPWSDAWVTWSVRRTADIEVARALFALSFERTRALDPNR